MVSHGGFYAETWHCLILYWSSPIYVYGGHHYVLSAGGVMGNDPP